MRARRLLVVAALAGVLVAVGAIALPHAWRPTAGPAPVDGRVGAPDVSGGDPGSGIATAQRRLRQVPGDWVTWAQLGFTYVQQARVTADPTWYPKADGALHRSLDLRATGNWQAMVGLGALANARHEFSDALAWGLKAQQINAYAASVYGVIADARTQLGDAAQARAAVQRMLDVQPGVAAFTRASYDLELHGQDAQARAALVRAMADATDRSDIAFCRYYLGELAFNDGQPAQALTHYRAALDADPTYRLAHAGLGKADAALGDLAGAIAEYDQVVQALPLPNLLVEYGDVLTAAGHPDRARQQFDLLDAELRLFGANGVSDHLTPATFAADHGDPARALAEARTEWDARHNVIAADALGWALHRAGDDREALRYATIATGLGWHNAAFYYHRGAISAALHDAAAARTDLERALTINPYFDPLQAPIARHLLSTVETPR